MRTYLECIPCFFRQALEAARMVTEDECKQKAVLDAVALKIPNFPLEATPPEMGSTIYGAVREITNHGDPYRVVKEESNRKALTLYPELKRKVEEAEDPLLMAVRFAIAGNVIDFGANPGFDLDQELEEIETRPFAVFDYQVFKKALGQADEVLYLGDNAGEIVFDRLLIEQLSKPVVFVVRGAPVINDATLDDAQVAGIDQVAKVISSGIAVPGTILRLCSKKFLQHYEKASVIISKGQGNYETLSEEKRSIFFLLKAKCPVIARHLEVEVGDIVLKKAT